MARNSAGVYSLAQSAFVTLTTISSAAMNSNFSDLATALTQSIDTRGYSTLTGCFTAAAGTVSAPGISFAAAMSTGWYISASNEFSFASGGVQTHRWNQFGLTMQSSQLVDLNGHNCYALPVGLIVPYGGSSAPTHWLLCFGQTLAQATYPALFAVLGSTYGSSAGGNFTMPDLRGQAPFGLDNMGGTAANRITNASSGIVGTTLGATGGTQNFVITHAQFPNYTLTDNSANHGHTYNTPSSNASGFSSAGSNIIQSTSTQTTGSATTGVTLASGGSGTALANMSPLMILNYIIYTGI